MKDRKTLPVRSICLLSLIAVMLLGACSPGVVPQTGASTPPSLSLELSGTAITAGGSAAPGVTTVSINNTSTENRSIVLARLNAGVTADQFSQSLSQDEMAAVSLVKIAGGRDAAAGKASQFVADLKEGTYVVIAFPESDAAPLLTTFQVTGSGSGQEAPQASQTVDMVDFAFVLPADLKSGSQTWQITNTGSQWHELVLVKPAPDMTQEKLLDLFHSGDMSGPPPFEEIGTFGPISEGERAWMTFDLQPGTYMAICFLPDFASGQSHLEKGMITTFTVK